MTFQAILILESGSKDGFSDPRDPFGMGTGLLDKSYSGDNRLEIGRAHV